MSKKVSSQEMHKDFQGVPKQIQILTSQVDNLLRELQYIHEIIPVLNPDVHDIRASLSLGVQNLIKEYEAEIRQIKEETKNFMDTTTEKVNELEEIIRSNRMSIQVTPTDPINPKPGRIWMIGNPDR